MIERDILDRAAHRIEKSTGIPFDHILINATHTHHAPTTVTVHGYEREEAFTRQVEDKIVQAAEEAARKLTPCTFLFRLGEESSVGKNSRLLLGDGTIYWVGPRDDAVRPTGPFDPELPVMAFRRNDGKLEAVLFNHSTHTIGVKTPGVRSPSFYGLAAQELEKERGGTVLFFEGASGSTHNLDVPTPEAITRIRQAVADALDSSRVHPVNRVNAIRDEMDVRVRHFREDDDDRAVTAYCTKRIKDESAARSVIETFRADAAEARAEAGRGAEDLGPGHPDRGCRDRWGPGRVSSRPWARRSSGARRSGTPTSSNWPTITSATSRTGNPTIAAAIRSGPGCTATSSRARARRSSTMRSRCWAAWTHDGAGADPTVLRRSQSRRGVVKIGRCGGGWAGEAGRDERARTLWEPGWI